MRSTTRARRALAAIAASALLLTGTLSAASAAQAAPPASAVTRMAALGDSITQAAMTCSSLTSCPTNSWSTGSTVSVNSHLLRLRAAGATGLVNTSVFNDAKSGAGSSALPAQAQTAAGQGAQYVTIEIGAIDACTRTVAQMTPTAQFTTNVRTALATLAASSGSPEIFVASIPSLQRLYDINKSSLSARLAWSLLGTCQSMLANPSSGAAADVARRTMVQQRVNEFNQALFDACTATPKCRFDGFAVANYAFAKSDISTRDYFHPSLSGQATLANLTWQRTQWVS
ncbi:SGNH/GDSL hydrolase family protein [Microbacterium sp. NPDC056044]|uniref:SGNH/GDSL hydrolase family protein n=1 Tax=Microbacterium sp. NPDC056044 TaxID=3345690 RepID=UPI0035D6BD24